MKFSMIGIILLVIFVCMPSLVIWYVICEKQMHIWIMDYLCKSIKHKPRIVSGTVNIYVCIVDHFEPMWNKASYEQERARIDEWVKKYPILASKHKDSNGRHPQHTFFYPEEEYRSEHLDKLARLCGDGFGDVEIHLHHDNDTGDNLREKLNRFKTVLREKHGLLRVNEKTGIIEYGFIHGNWTLDNSGKGGRFCGVNNELTILRETGCYADYTFPSAPSETQPRKINSIYYAIDDPERPKSYDTGLDVETGNSQAGDIMMIQGPLTINWRNRKWGVFPKIENGEISKDASPTPERVDLWIKQWIHVKGRPDHIFVKLHTHGANENNFDVLLGNSMDKIFSYIEREYNDEERYRLHYVTAFELYLTIKRLETF